MEDLKEKLQAEATALGVDVDGRWGDARLAQEIEAARKREAEKDEEGKAYGDGADDADEHSGEDDARAEEGREPADDRDRDGAVGDPAIIYPDHGGERPSDDDVDVSDGEAPSATTGDEAEDPRGDLQDPAGSEAVAFGSETMAGTVSAAPAVVEDVGAKPRAVDDDAAPSEPLAGDAKADAPPVADPGDGSADGLALAADAIEPDPFGGLPPDPVEIDDAGMREAYLTARLAMTGPMVAAFNAACAVAGSPAWFAGEADVGSYVPALVNVAVPFVREWPAAPTEALYEHVRRAVSRLGHVDPFTDLPLAHRIAWDVFRTVLVQVDEAIEQETRRREAETVATADRGWGQRDIDPDDTLYAPATSREQRSDLGRAREREEHAKLVARSRQNAESYDRSARELDALGETDKAAEHRRWAQASREEAELQERQRA